MDRISPTPHSQRLSGARPSSAGSSGLISFLRSLAGSEGIGASVESLTGKSDTGARRTDTLLVSIADTYSSFVESRGKSVPSGKEVAHEKFAETTTQLVKYLKGELEGGSKALVDSIKDEGLKAVFSKEGSKALFAMLDAYFSNIDRPVISQKSGLAMKSLAFELVNDILKTCGLASVKSIEGRFRQGDAAAAKVGTVVYQSPTHSATKLSETTASANQSASPHMIAGISREKSRGSDPTLKVDTVGTFSAYELSGKQLKATAPPGQGDYRVRHIRQALDVLDGAPAKFVFSEPAQTKLYSLRGRLSQLSDDILAGKSKISDKALAKVLREAHTINKISEYVVSVMERRPAGQAHEPLDIVFQRLLSTEGLLQTVAEAKGKVEISGASERRMVAEELKGLRLFEGASMKSKDAEGQNISVNIHYTNRSINFRAYFGSTALAKILPFNRQIGASNRDTYQFVQQQAQARLAALKFSDQPKDKKEALKINLLLSQISGKANASHGSILGRLFGKSSDALLGEKSLGLLCDMLGVPYGAGCKSAKDRTGVFVSEVFAFDDKLTKLVDKALSDSKGDLSIIDLDALGKSLNTFTSEDFRNLWFHLVEHGGNEISEWAQGTKGNKGGTILKAIFERLYQYADVQNNKLFLLGLHLWHAAHSPSKTNADWIMGIFPEVASFSEAKVSLTSIFEKVKELSADEFRSGQWMAELSDAPELKTFLTSLEEMKGKKFAKTLVENEANASVVDPNKGNRKQLMRQASSALSLSPRSFPSSMRSSPSMGSLNSSANSTSTDAMSYDDTEFFGFPEDGDGRLGFPDIDKYSRETQA